MREREYFPPSNRVKEVKMSTRAKKVFLFFGILTGVIRLMTSALKHGSQSERSVHL